MDAKEAIETIEIAIAEVEWNYPMSYAVAFEKAIEALKKQEPEIVRCRDCKYWKDRHIKQNDGRERQYRDSDNDGLIHGYVTISVGINVGAMCCYEDGRGWGGKDKRVYRNEDDYCSRGEKRPCSYDEWWGIVDGYYPDNPEVEKAK